MTLLDAPSYDAARAKRRRNLLLSAIAALIVAGILVFLCWNVPAEHRMNRFFAAVEARDYPKAYGIWNNDADWQQHTERYAGTGYPYGRFVNDWSETGEYGKIASHKILYATSSLGNSTLMAVEVNGRKTPLTLGIEKKTHAFSFTPFDLSPQTGSFGMTYWQVSYK
jgi:hypothetical protein